MAKVDFYILGAQGPQHRQAFACRLAEKAYRLEHTVHIHTASRGDAERLDDLLWTFRDGSFVPHRLVSAEPAGEITPVTIGYVDSDVGRRDLLINLCDEIPAIAGSFVRVAELVTSDEDCKQKSRRRFVEYRDNGYTLETHNV